MQITIHAHRTVKVQMTINVPIDAVSVGGKALNKKQIFNQFPACLNCLHIKFTKFFQNRNIYQLLNNEVNNSLPEIHIITRSTL